MVLLILWVRVIVKGVIGFLRWQYRFPRRNTSSFSVGAMLFQWSPFLKF